LATIEDYSVVQKEGIKMGKEPKKIVVRKKRTTENAGGRWQILQSENLKSQIVTSKKMNWR